MFRDYRVCSPGLEKCCVGLGRRNVARHATTAATTTPITTTPTAAATATATATAATTAPSSVAADSNRSLLPSVSSLNS